MDEGIARSAALVAIGTELILDGRHDLNGSWIAARLGDRGLRVARRVILPDDEQEIAAVLRELDGQAGLVVVTGGLGPTCDDLTREGIARAFGLALREDPEVLAQIQALYRARGREVSAWSARQALVPDGALVLPNKAGTAPGLSLRRPSGTQFYFLPGVPHEMERFVTGTILPGLRAGEAGERVRRFKVAGLVEVQVQEILDGLVPQGAEAPGSLTLLASPGEIAVILRSRDAAWLDRAAADARDRLGAHIVGENLEEGLEHAVGRQLAARGLTLATAESCTGGLLGQLITRVPGASAWYRQGWITYTNESKQLMLGVSVDELRAHGAVSAEVARAMAEGARRIAAADYALAITGIAGPDGGTAEKPVGLVFVALAGPAGCTARRHLLLGDRETIRLSAARIALNLLRVELAG